MSSRRFSDRTHSKWALFSGFTGSLVGSNVCALFFTIRRDYCRPAGLEEARNENCTFFLGYRITELPHHDLFVLFCFNLLGPTTQRIKTLGSNRKLKLTGERVGDTLNAQPNRPAVRKGSSCLFKHYSRKSHTQHQQQMNTPASKCGLLNRVLLASAGRTCL